MTLTDKEKIEESLKYIDSFLSVPEFDENGDDNWDGQTSRDLLTQIKMILEYYGKTRGKTNRARYPSTSN